MSKPIKLLKLLSIIMVLSLMSAETLARSEPVYSGKIMRPKAVLIVGPIDPPTNTQTNSSISEALEAAKLLRDRGVKVVTLFHPNAQWEKVKEVSQGANIFMYWGHGFNEDPNSYEGEADAYGLVLSSNSGSRGYELVSRYELNNSINLAQHSIAILSHTCYAAGDNQSEKYVGTAKAREYVANYSETFLAMGAEAYFANNFEGSGAQYVGMLFNGNNDMKDVFASAEAFDASSLINGKHPTAGYNLMLDPVKDSNNRNIYSQAFAGKPNLKAKEVLMPYQAETPAN